MTTDHFDTLDDLLYSISDNTDADDADEDRRDQEYALFG